MSWISFGALSCRGKKTWWMLASRCCWNRARPWHASELVSFLIGLRTYQHLGNMIYSPWKWRNREVQWRWDWKLVPSEEQSARVTVHRDLKYDAVHRDVTRHHIPNEQDGRTSACRTGVYPSNVHGYRTWFFCSDFYSTNPRGQTELLCKEKPTKVIFVSA